jgi:glyoxylase-like metal-dependent hydrolase (beta-lactamase superfamily II)
VIVERSLHPQFLSNTYLVGDQPGGSGMFVDAGGPVGPLLDAVDRHGVTPTHVLLTHHHYDHVCEVGDLVARWPGLSVLIHPLERSQVAAATGTLEPDSVLALGALEVHALPTPGHTAGMLSLLVRAADAGAEPGASAGDVFTGDTLFRNSVGGVRAPGHTTYDDLRRSIMDTLMRLPPATVIRPGHTDPSTVAEEWENNPFIRIWRGLDPEGHRPCTVGQQPATLILLAEDYDGGHKAWVRWPDGSDDIVPGSMVELGPEG